MRLTDPDYIRLVKAAYKKRQADGTLPLLTSSTPANIRRECMNVFGERYTKKDEPALRAFFGPTENEKELLKRIEGFETDKFRSLNKFLKGEVKETDRANLELLAWLVDFKHRPYFYGKEVELTDEERMIIAGVESSPSPSNHESNESNTSAEKASEEAEAIENKMEEKEVLNEHTTLLNEPEQYSIPDKNSFVPQAPANTSTKSIHLPFQKRIIMALSLLIISLGTCVVWQNGISFGNGNNGCMYWTGDHYEAVPCNKAPKRSAIVPYNEPLLRDFKRITRPDTITERSVGVIWCININGGVEYYTTGGRHPVATNKSLRLLSKYMFDRIPQRK